MQKADYFTLTLHNLTPEEAEHAAALCFDVGAAGTHEDLDFQQTSREYEPVTIARKVTSLKVYFEKFPPHALIEELGTRFSSAQLHVEGQKNKDWLTEWKKGFQAFPLVAHTWVVPSWCDTPAEAQKIIRIDPGMAFGTGTHETTQLAAGMLFDYSKDGRPDSLIDVGTGTGILAILAEQLGFVGIIGNDNDPEARRVARENVEINKSKVQIVDEDISEISHNANWVVANIIDGVLVKLQDALKGHVLPNGYLLLTGILSERDEVFRNEFNFSGFDVVERRVLGEWVGYLLKKTK